MRRHRSGQSWRCRSKRQCATGTFSWPTIVRPTWRGAWIGRNYSCFSRRSCCKTNIPGHTGRSFKKGMFALFCSPNLFWVFLAGYVPGYRGVGDIRPACLFPLVKSKCFLDFWGSSVLDCSSVPPKMAWRSVARAIRMVARLGGPGCDIFDVSQLRYELDSMFQELGTPPSRCCRGCGCAMSCVGLITADIDQAF